jgi:hypothetical protein
MMFIGVVIYCASMEVTTCSITSKAEPFKSLEECQKSVVEIVNLSAAQGYVSRGYCAPVKPGMQT